MHTKEVSHCCAIKRIHCVEAPSNWLFLVAVPAKNAVDQRA